ncbi:hypothetical protein HCN51_48020 [Nonomuraea sp. FMUSA5-5]|uniref:histidine kinase n=1 Tax=Nonomuraea composti TaxID=2720023 RepID=A0ABX1BH99_9ACTN|nr:ATP-binding protein [Nonomuraea sp. FMUSA5-5]NJP97091.1 hypothetical protein [Nonomuraea sp. FMUSA5-5]
MVSPDRSRSHSAYGGEHAATAAQAVLTSQRQFVADASHELRTPVAGLRVELEEALLHPEQTDLIGSLHRALKSVDRLEAIVSDLFLLASLRASTAAEYEEWDLVDLTRREVLRRSDHLPIQLRMAPNAFVRAVPSQIVRVLETLLDNAQRHASATVQLEVIRGDAHVELVVTDDGEGVAEAQRERIFEQFTRIDGARSRTHGGAGLGLTIAREIALAHCGSLDVGQADSGGARFSLRLPRLR